MVLLEVCIHGGVLFEFVEVVFQFDDLVLLGLDFLVSDLHFLLKVSLLDLKTLVEALGDAFHQFGQNLRRHRQLLSHLADGMYVEFLQKFVLFEDDVELLRAFKLCSDLHFSRVDVATEVLELSTQSCQSRVAGRRMIGPASSSIRFLLRHGRWIVDVSDQGCLRRVGHQTSG